MNLWPRSMNRMMDDYCRDTNRFERSHFPYRRNTVHSVLHIANEAQHMVNDESKFAASLDFRPEELKVHLEGKEPTIEGKYQHKDDTSFTERLSSMDKEQESSQRTYKEYTLLKEFDKSG
uniref:Uncharacterized protein n=1 Tax=Angiostrongylus cantonensis TaxID=6313 RepID=A0A0K0CYZ0_ANGCA